VDHVPERGCAEGLRRGLRRWSAATARRRCASRRAPPPRRHPSGVRPDQHLDTGRPPASRTARTPPGWRPPAPRPAAAHPEAGGDQPLGDDVVVGGEAHVRDEAGPAAHRSMWARHGHHPAIHRSPASSARLSGRGARRGTPPHPGHRVSGSRAGSPSTPVRPGVPEHQGDIGSCRRAPPPLAPAAPLREVGPPAPGARRSSPPRGRPARSTAAAVGDAATAHPTPTRAPPGQPRSCSAGLQPVRDRVGVQPAPSVRPRVSVTPRPARTPGGVPAEDSSSRTMRATAGMGPAERPCPHRPASGPGDLAEDQQPARITTRLIRSPKQSWGCRRLWWRSPWSCGQAACMKTIGMLGWDELGVDRAVLRGLANQMVLANAAGAWRARTCWSAAWTSRWCATCLLEGPLGPPRPATCCCGRHGSFEGCRRRAVVLCTNYMHRRLLGWRPA
jgi:hypothetical protein